MKGYEDIDSWSKEYNVLLDQGHLDMVVGITNCNKIVLTNILGMLVVHNLETQTQKNIDISSTKYSYYYDSYEESLALLDKGELLPPVYLSYESTNDDGDDANDDNDKDESDGGINTPSVREFLKHLLCINVSQLFFEQKIITKKCCEV